MSPSPYVARVAGVKLSFTTRLGYRRRSVLAEDLQAHVTIARRYGGGDTSNIPRDGTIHNGRAF
jgi:hypothetical protein